MSLRFVLKSVCVFALTLPMSGCQSLNDLILQPTESERLDREIELERKRQELERLKNQGQPSAAPTPTPAPSNKPLNIGNQSPQISVLDAVLATTSKNNDTVRIVVKASDADGDPLEYTWSSVYNGLSATKGEQVVWFPGDQALAGKTNIVTVTVIDKKGGTSTASLNIFVQNDGTLLVREDTAAKPVLNGLLATRTDDGRILLRAAATDPSGGLLRYRWESSAGQLTTPNAASSIWQASGSESGEITIRLIVSNAAGLQSEGSFKFARAANGNLSGGFTGTDINLPTTGAILPGNPQAGSSNIQITGSLLVLQAGEVFRYDPRSRSKQQLLSLKSLNSASAQVPRAKLFYQTPASKAHLVVDKPATALGQDSQVVHYELDITTGETREVEALSYSSQTQLSVTLNDLVWLVQPDSSVTTYFLDQGQIKGLFTLTARFQPATLRVGSFKAENLGPALPADIRVKSVSPQGKLLAQRDNNLLLIDPSSGSEQVLLNLATQALTSAHSFSWNHKGDKLAFLTRDAANGGQSGGSRIYTLDLKGQLKQILNNELQQDRLALSWSLDDLYLGFSEYAYVYIQSPTDRRTRNGEYHLVAIDNPTQRSSTKLSFPELGDSQAVWVP